MHPLTTLIEDQLQKYYVSEAQLKLREKKFSMLGDLKTIIQHDVHHKKEDLQGGGGGHGHSHNHGHSHSHAKPKHDHGHGHSHGKHNHHDHGHSDPFKKTGGKNQHTGTACSSLKRSVTLKSKGLDGLNNFGLSKQLQKKVVEAKLRPEDYLKNKSDEDA